MGDAAKDRNPKSSTETTELLIGALEMDLAPRRSDLDTQQIVLTLDASLRTPKKPARAKLPRRPPQ
jgi:hypothetical protein